MMALVVADRVKETSTTAGTGTLTLAGAVDGFQSFAVIGNGNTTYYSIVDSTANTWEVGIGTYTSSGTTLSRDTVLSNSSGTTSPISFASNSKDVFATYPAGKSVHEDADNTAYAEQLGASNGIVINKQTVATSFSIPSGYSAMSAGPITINSGISVTVPSGSKWVVF
jgi:hypothetical protein